jgi:hypothetical protein
VCRARVEDVSHALADLSDERVAERLARFARRGARRHQHQLVARRRRCVDVLGQSVRARSAAPAASRRAIEARLYDALVLLRVLLHKRPTVAAQLAASAVRVQLLFAVMRSGSLRAQRLALRLLQSVLVHTTPDALQAQSGWREVLGASADVGIVAHLFTVTGRALQIVSARPTAAVEHARRRCPTTTAPLRATAPATTTTTTTTRCRPMAVWCRRATAPTCLRWWPRRRRCCARWRTRARRGARRLCASRASASRRCR